MPGTDTERFLQEMKLVKKKKTENVNIHAIYIIIFLKKKQAKKREYTREKYKNLSK